MEKTPEKWTFSCVMKSWHDVRNCWTDFIDWKNSFFTKSNMLMHILQYTPLIFCGAMGPEIEDKLASILHSVVQWVLKLKIS